MYSNDGKKIVQLCLSSKDLTYVMKCYKFYLSEYKNIVKEYLVLRIKKADKEEQIDQLMIKWKSNVEVLT